jgi:Transglycosylase SLT domain/Putative peptidoglycan binding domain/LysM domain
MRRPYVVIAALLIGGIACSPAAGLSKVQVPGLQVALYRYGLYHGHIDGIAGPMTKRAVVQFQRKARLAPDGVAGPRTRAALGRFGRPLFGKRTMERGMFGFDVSVLQFLLARRGFAPPRLTSFFGGTTDNLVRKFQRKAGLTVDGIVGPATRRALLGRRGAGRGSSQPSTAMAKHLVQPGETLTAIAARHGTTVAALARRNRLDPQGVLLAGIRLVVPAGGGSSSPASRSEIKDSLARWAAHYGVDAQLARALAWQESGFQSHVRSGIGAFGVMQVTPATWSFVEMFVIGEKIPRTADGNVRVGVAYLDHLLTEFRGNTRLAIGAYYQGPAGVRKQGLFKETKHFVANVLALRGRV